MTPKPIISQRVKSDSRTHPNHNPHALQRSRVPGNYGSYESLKASLTASARTPAEYDAAIRQAARIAGV
ncbi:hypothetical protein [Candidatus Nitrotoga arctica]|uniref:hypothetical protein n=1 Tax=Candidatus Nitrotoga arctica TaxID=453162 RepID=UPI001EFAAEC2|nr:hypothetical protein [Candidatus Nitrotoga arctica]